MKTGEVSAAVLNCVATVSLSAIVALAQRYKQKISLSRYSTLGQKVYNVYFIVQGVLQY